jgi:hypothetical protein
MSNATDKPRIASPVSKEPAPKSAHVSNPSGSNPSGRAKFDSRGNAVWEWQTEDGDFSTDVSTQRVKKLEAPELSLEETARAKKLDSGSKKEPSRGFNPYDNSASRVPRDPDGKKPMLQPAQPPASTARKPVKDLKRLQEWMEMKKRLASQKNDD